MKRLVILALALIPSLAACSKKDPEPSSSFKPAEAPPEQPGPEKLESIDDKVGTGREAKTGDTVNVHYTGTLMSGKKFDSSRDRGEPFEFTLGNGSVIKGWDEGVVGMRVGGKRRLTIPWQKAYGEAGHPPDIPPKAALKFDIELIGIN
jgi:FKBP-type peptidyl-prolyl cis-trans isomerase FkpA